MFTDVTYHRANMEVGRASVVARANMESAALARAPR